MFQLFWQNLSHLICASKKKMESRCLASMKQSVSWFGGWINDIHIGSKFAVYTLALWWAVQLSRIRRILLWDKQCAHNFILIKSHTWPSIRNKCNWFIKYCSEDIPHMQYLILLTNDNYLQIINRINYLANFFLIFKCDMNALSGKMSDCKVLNSFFFSFFF